MKLTYTTADGRITVELEGKTHKDIWRQLASFQEVFEDTPEATIGGKVVSGGDVRFRVRKAKYQDEKGKEKEAEYFEKVVVGGPLVYYKKHYGVLDDGSDSLFPKKAPEGENIQLGRNGWHKYNKEVSSDTKSEKHF